MDSGDVELSGAAENAANMRAFGMRVVRTIFVFAIFAVPVFLGANVSAASYSYLPMTAAEVLPSYNQAKKSSQLDLEIKQDMTPTHIIIDQNKMSMFYACENYKLAHQTKPQPAKYPGYNLEYSGNIASGTDTGRFTCAYASKGAKDGGNIVFHDGHRGESYALVYNFGSVHKDSNFDAKNKSFTGANDYIKFTFPSAAVDVDRLVFYDVQMKISNITLKAYDCVETSNTNDEKKNTHSAILYGWGDDMKDNYGSFSGISHFAAKSLDGHRRCDSAVKFNVSIELYPHDNPGAGKIENRLVLWAVSDIDIPDKIGSKDQVYNPTNEYFAEHLRFLEKDGYLRGAVRVVDDDTGDTMLKTYISMVNTGTEAAPTGVLSYKYNAIYHNVIGTIGNNTGSALFVLNASDVAFEWGGSTCATTIVSAPYSEFTGKTVLRYDGQELTDSVNVIPPLNSQYSKAFSFEHYISRTKGYIDNEMETFTVTKNDWMPQTSYAGQESFSLSDGANYKLVYSTTGSYYGNNNEYRASLEPGETKTYTHRLRYRLASVSSTTIDADPVSIRLSRPPARFFGTVAPSVKNGDIDATIPNDNRVKITSADGSYTVKFTSGIKRLEDGAGDTVGSAWRTHMTKDGTVPSNTYGYHAGTANRTEGQEKSDDIQEYTYTGKLRYGESITFCGGLHYTSLVDKTAGNDESDVMGCVIVWRGNAQCSFDDRFEYGLNYAVNTGRIGVQNKNLAGSPTFTVPNDLTAVSVYARPTDNVRFFYDMCAGVMYPIKQNNLPATVQYKATGESTKSNGEGNGYLFRQDVSVVDGAFFNPRFWTNKNDGHTYNFLRNSIEASFTSPSNHVGTNYRCGGSTESGWYQVAGKEDCARNSSYDIGTIDAGSVITQRLEWNEQTYNNGLFANSPQAASANVVVPYNYVLRPYVTNNSGNTGKVAYLGETLTMTPGVVTVARANVFPVGGSQNYATITKPTDITVKYYFKTSSGSLISESAVESSSRSQYRLNTDGLMNGTVSTDSQKSVDDGGTQLPKVTVQIPNSGVSVGDKVCVEVSVYPADSHDMKDANSVSGAGINDIALSETSADSNNRVTSVSCSTIAKKPSMSVESSNAYSATQFKTANYTRTVGTKKFNFGSWSEYGVFGRVVVGTSTSNSLFASGAALGYSRDGYPASRVANASRANDESSADSNKVSTASNSSKCTFMTQTFANASCNSSSTSLGGVMASQYEQRIKERYGSSSGSFITADLPTVSYNGATYYDVSGYSGADVIVEPSGIVRFDSKENLYISSLPNITNEQYASKNIEKPNRTIVYSAPNKSIVIDGNLNEDNGNKSDMDSITQVIIIAKNVYFTNNPTYINAIIIANEVNTCRFSGSNRVAVGGQGGANVIDSGTCTNSLRFDSPVIVKKLVLNRIAGAGNGDDAIRRAEIFNLNMANYLWSFNQMSRLSQATTTYSRELPTRY